MIALSLTESGRKVLDRVPPRNTLKVRILSTLGDQNHATVDDIATELDADRGTVASASKELFKEGLIRKVE